MAQCDLDVIATATFGPAQQPACPSPTAFVRLARHLGERRDLVFLEHPVDPLHGLLGDQLAKDVRVDLALLVGPAEPLVLSDIAHGHHRIDAVGLVAYVLVDPSTLDLELLGREGQRAENAEASGVGDGGDHVAAVAEGENRNIDPEEIAELGAHGSPLS
jgi:hypothetical protein